MCSGVIMSNFTQGEWSIDNSGYFTRVFSDGVLICEIKSTTDHNAHLIASAPDMYRVIENIVKYQDCNRGELQEYLNNSGLSFKMLLAKARGE